jgi:hypothetical protein
LPGVQVDNEFNLIAQSLGATISRLNELQRADGKLKSEALDNTEIINTAKLAAYQATMAMLNSTISSLNASAVTSAQEAEDASDSADAAAASAAQSAASAQASAVSASNSQQYASLSEAARLQSSLSASLSSAARIAAQASAANAEAASVIAVGTTSEALLLKTYLDSEYKDVLNGWQNLNDVQNKHQSREHLGVQGDVSHAALFHEFKTTLRYFRPPQVNADVDDAEQLLRKWFGLDFNVVTDQFDSAPDFPGVINGTVVFGPSGPVVWSGSGDEQFNLKYPSVAWDFTLTQRVEVLRMKLRSFGVTLTNTMLFGMNELQGSVKWPTSQTLSDGNSSTVDPVWTDINQAVQAITWPEDSVLKRQVPVTQNRFLTLEDFAQGLEGNSVPYVTQYVESVVLGEISSNFSQDVIDALGASSSPSYFNPFVTTDGLASFGYATSTDLTNGLNTKLTNTINWTGAYNGATTYAAGDGIVYDNALYVLKNTIGAAGYDPIGYASSWTKLLPSFPDQSLNSSSDVAFNSTLIGSGALDFISIGNGTISFPDGTTQATAATAYDQSLNTTDQVEFSVVQTSGVNLDNSGGLFVDTGAGMVLLGSNLNNGNYFDLTAQGLGFYDSSYNLVGGFDIYNGVTFPDSTVQTTAAVSTPDATETVAGKVELATETETLRGLAENKVVTVKQLREIFRKRRFKQLPITTWFTNSTGNGATAGTNAFYHSMAGINVVGATGGSTVKNSVGNIFRNTAANSMYMWRWSRGIYAGFSTGRTTRNTAHTIYFTIGPAWGSHIYGELGDVGYTGLAFRGFQVCINGDNIWLVYYNGTTKFSSSQFAIMPAGSSVGFEVSVEYVNGTVTGYLNGVEFGNVTGAAIADTYVTANNHGFHVSINTVNYVADRITIYPQNYYVETEYIE